MQAEMKDRGVLLSPIPRTYFCDSRRREAKRVKSLSDETMQKPSRLLWYNKSIVSMMRAESDEFLRIVLLYCWTGWMALSKMVLRHDAIWGVVQLP